MAVFTAWMGGGGGLIRLLQPTIRGSVANLLLTLLKDPAFIAGSWELEGSICVLSRFEISSFKDFKVTMQCPLCYRREMALITGLFYNDCYLFLKNHQDIFQGFGKAACNIGNKKDFLLKFLFPPNEQYNIQITPESSLS